MAFLATFARWSAYLPVNHALMGIVAIRAPRDSSTVETVINARVTKANVPGKTETFVKNALITLGIPP